MKVFLTVAALVSAALVFGQDAGPTVDTHYGKVQGGSGQSRDGRMFYSFRGIPYAKAPERFQNPEVPDNWEGVKDATKPAPKCVQYDPFEKKVIGQEDCMNLNIFTPKLPMAGQDKILLPVVVYLHPGLNQFGGNEDYDPKYWMDEDVVLVVPNWRQNVFGFLNTNDKYASGNQGLRDQVEALKFIQKNIENFGGDKSRVTIIGSSTGASDAMMHTISPLSKGLVSNVVAMGDSPVSRYGLIRTPIKQAKKLGDQVGCPTDSSQALVMCLKQKDAKEIVEKMAKLDFHDLNADNFLSIPWFGPTVETPQEGQTEDDLMIPDHPATLLATGKIVNKVPLIIGGNEFDGINPISAILLKNPALFEKLDKQWDELAPLLFFYKDTAADNDIVSSKIKQFYFEGKPVSNETFVKLSEIFMDRYMGYPAVATATLYSKSAPVYLYYFSHTPETSSLKMYGVENQNYGMAHLDELQLLFKVAHEKLTYPEITKDSKEYQLSHGLVKLLGSFAETGKPTKTWGEGKEWKKNEGGDVSKWYKLGDVTELQSPPPEHFQKRVGFWAELYKKEMAKDFSKPEVEKF